MDFGDAIRALKEEKRVARAGWNGKGMWLRLVSSKTRAVAQPNPNVPGALGIHPNEMLRAYIEMKDATDFFVPWLASQTDMLAEDWEIV